MSKLIGVIVTVIVAIVVYLSGKRSQELSFARKEAASSKKLASDMQASASKSKAEAKAVSVEASLVAQTATMTREADEERCATEEEYKDTLAKIDEASNRGDFDYILAIARQQAKKARELMENAKD